MKKSRYTPEQIAFALRQVESGAPVVGVCRRMGVAEQTFYRCQPDDHVIEAGARGQVQFPPTPFISARHDSGWS